MIPAALPTRMTLIYKANDEIFLEGRKFIIIEKTAQARDIGVHDFSSFRRFVPFSYR